MAKSAKHEKKRVQVRMPIFSEESLSDLVEDAAYPDTGKGASPVSVYGQLLGERNRYIDARHVAQQRIDQIVAGAAAAALVLSITLIIGIAPSPAAQTAWLLGASWVALAVALGSSPAHHHLAQRALDDYVRELDVPLACATSPRPRAWPPRCRWPRRWHSSRAWPSWPSSPFRTSPSPDPAFSRISAAARKQLQRLTQR